MPGAKRVVLEYVVDGPTLKNKKGSVCQPALDKAAQAGLNQPEAAGRGTSTTRKQPVGAGCP